MLLTDKVALISGAGRNNGKAISLKFAEEGADLILVAREREAELNAVVQQCEERGAKVLPILADATDPADVARLTQAALDRFGRVDAAINVVGFRPARPGPGDQLRRLAAGVRSQRPFVFPARAGCCPADGGARIGEPGGPGRDG